MFLGDPDHEFLEYVLFIIDSIEYIVVIFFLIEYLIRFVICPMKIKFFFGLMNLIDFLALIPFFLSILLEVRVRILKSNHGAILRMLSFLVVIPHLSDQLI